MYETKKYGILFIDDEGNTLSAFERFFEDDFTVFAVRSPVEADAILKNKHSEIAVIISDNNFSKGLRGLDFIKKWRLEYPNIIRILTTAYSSEKLVIEAINSGEIFRYIQKPWDIKYLEKTFQEAIDIFAKRKAIS